MASSTNSKLVLWSSSISILLLLLLQYCSAISRDDICKLTQYPSYCIETLPNNTSAAAADIHYYGRFSVQTSLARSQKFLKSVQRHIHSFSAPMAPMATRALEDCREIVSSNVNMLESCVVIVNGTNEVLPFTEANDLQDSLSAVMTNLYTCLDELESTPTAETIKNDLSQMINDDVKVHSISLALCTQGWVPKDKRDSSMTATPTLPPTQAWSSLPNFRLAAAKGNRKAILESPLKGLKVIVDHNGDEQGPITIKNFVVVSKDGSWDFTNITDAINAAPNSYNGRAAASDGYFLVYVKAGVYEEYVKVGTEKTNVFLLGDGIGRTIISGSHNNADGWSISSSATLFVAGQGFVGMNLTIVNTAGPHKFQAVALRNSADQSTFYSCSIEGYQDTLYIHTHRQFYRDCDIYGTIDYIFGNGSAVLQNCNIYVRKPLTGHSTIITAHGRTDPNQNTGFSIHNCNVLPTPDLAASNARARRGRKTKTFLGRPWRDYCRVIFMQSYMDEFVDSVGWHRWDKSSFGLRDSYMAEYDNWGAGSHTTKRAKWLAVHLINATEAQHFTVSSFINGDLWLPKTGVPYTGGLV